MNKDTAIAVRNCRTCCSCSCKLTFMPHFYLEPVQASTLTAELELAQGLDEGHALDVAHSAAQLNHAHIRNTVLAIHRLVCNALDPVLCLSIG